MDLRAIITKIVREQLPLQVFPATVKSVNKQEASLDAQPLELSAPECFDVRLRAVDDGSLHGLISWPQVGSVVLIGLIDNDLNTAFVVAASEVESFTLSTSAESLATVLQDLLTEIKGMKFTTNQGPTLQLLNAPAFDLIANRLTTLLTA